MRCSALGYEHHVFISWPHQIEKRGADFVRALAEGLSDRFRTYGGGSVYWDDRLKAGYRWDDALRRNLCRSAAVISIILPTFFQSHYCSIDGQSLSGCRRREFLPRMVSRPPSSRSYSPAEFRCQMRSQACTCRWTFCPYWLPAVPSLVIHGGTGCLTSFERGSSRYWHSWLRRRLTGTCRRNWR
jgi:hypothetical protein